VTATPLEHAPPGLGDGRRLLLKREDVHELGAFKWRGALPTLEAYRAGGARAVVPASTGNHGAATACAAERVGLDAVVYAPETVSRMKLALLEANGAEVRLVGADLDEAKERARLFAFEKRVPFFEDGAERAQYEGYGAIAAEILEQTDEPPAAVVVPVGNGALLAGIGLVLCERAAEVGRVGVAAKEAPVMVESWEAGSVEPSSRSATFADGLAVRVAVPLAVEVLGEVAERMVLVSERELAHAVGALADAGIRAEGAAAAPLAALPQLDDVGEPVVLVVTGRNIDDELWARARERPESFPD
jgi:threonine dehydratase